MNELAVIDEATLADLGLGHLTDQEKQAVSEKIRTALEARVAVKITQGLSESQENELNNLLSGDDSQAAIDWMEKYIPNYQDVVKTELDGLISQIQHNNVSFVERL
jgi:hypothetical protein